MADVEGQRRMRAGFHDYAAAQRKASDQNDEAQRNSREWKLASFRQNSHRPFLSALTFTSTVLPCSTAGNFTGTHDALPLSMWLIG